MPGFSNTAADNATPRPPTDSLPLGAGAGWLLCPVEVVAVVVELESIDCDCCIIVDWGVDGEATVVLGVEV